LELFGSKLSVVTLEVFRA